MVMGGSRASFSGGTRASISAGAGGQVFSADQGRASFKGVSGSEGNGGWKDYEKVSKN